jgi:Leucine-rich repeat (LRR) protein
MKEVILKMKRTRKQIGSLLLSVCMVFTMLPTVVFAEEVDSGSPSSTSEITAFADLTEDVALQEVETGTTLEKLNFPSTLTVTVTNVTTGSAITATVSGDEVATDSEAQETKTQEKTTIDVSNWTADSDYKGETAGDYTFTPTLTIPEGTTLADGVTAPQIKVMVKKAATSMARGAEMQLLGTDITAEFTDDNFLAAVYNAINKTAPNPIYETDVSDIKSLDVSDNSIASLSGIAYFTALTELYCYKNQLTSLDVSSNSALTHLNCSFNQLTSLDVSSNTALNKLNCGNNQLKVLDVSSNSALDMLDCSSNQLTSLNLSSNSALDVLNCSSNQLTSLNLSSNTALTYLICGDNQLKVLDVSSNSALNMLDCGNNQLTSLDVSSNSALTYLNCSFNQLTLNLSSNTALTELECSSNQLTSLNLSSNSALAHLNCCKNQLTELKLDSNTALNKLNCCKNQLTELKLDSNTKLTYLDCSSNQLTSLDVSSNKILKKLYCHNNYMPNESAVTGLDKNLTYVIFGLQNSYSFTVNKGTASPTTAAKNTTVTITANTPDSGKQFKEWIVVKGGVTLANAKASSTTFTMPANAVEITATYEDIPSGVTSVTGVTLNKNNLSLYRNTTPNTATLTATIAPSNATDKSVRWQSSNAAVATVDTSGNVTAVGNGTATITVTTTGGYTASCIVTVSTYSNGGSSSSGGSSSGGSSSYGSTEKKTNQPVTVSAPITATAGKNGTASASIPDKSISDAITKAQAEAKEQGKTINTVSVTLNVTMPKGATALTATLTRSSLNSLVSAGVTNLKINGSPVTVTFDQKAFTQIQKKSNGNINITIAPKTNLSETAKKMIGSRPVYNITVSYGNNSTVSSFGDGVVTVAIPYTPANGEAIGGVYAVYVDEKGNATRIAGSVYDANSSRVIFTTPHFSMYGIGYTAPSTQFTDIGSHWAKESIDYVVGRGLLSGTKETTFAPDTAMTRGMLVTALGRLAEVDTKTYTTSSFNDVNADSAYRPYIEWAYSKGIIQGIGSNQFAPDKAITREEIADIIANFVKACGYTLPVTREVTIYADASSIGRTYKTAVTTMQQAGIMMGGTSNKFNPKSNATRAEVSSMLNRYIKLTIDPDTAQGWTLNDAGQYLYYQDGRALPGIQTIDGVKYIFNSNGVLQTGWVKDDDNWRFYSGKTMLVGWWDLGANGNNKTYYFAKDGLMVSGKWLEIDGKWYYFNTDGSLTRSTKIDGYEVDENGVRKTK